jgi:hypothetical protein
MPATSESESRQCSAAGETTIATPMCVCCAVQWCAVLCCAVLCCAVLCCSVKCGAVRCCAVLCCAVLCCAVLCVVCTLGKTLLPSGWSGSWLLPVWTPSWGHTHTLTHTRTHANAHAHTHSHPHPHPQPNTSTHTNIPTQHRHRHRHRHTPTHTTQHAQIHTQAHTSTHAHTQRSHKGWKYVKSKSTNVFTPTYRTRMWYTSALMVRDAALCCNALWSTPQSSQRIKSRSTSANVTAWPTAASRAEPGGGNDTTHTQ